MTDFDDDIEEAPMASEGDLAKLAAMAKVLRQKRSDAEELASKLAAKNAEIKEIEENDLPKLMLDIGMSEFSLTGGGKVELKTEHYCSITQEKSLSCFKWLRDNNHGAIIKRTLQTVFGKGDDDTADKIARLIKADAPKAKFSDKEGVHASTLKAFLKEQIKKGKFEEGSEEAQLFNLFVRRYAVIEMPEGGYTHNGGPPIEDEEF